MSNVIANSIQLGQSSLAKDIFSISAEKADGTLEIYSGTSSEKLDTLGQVDSLNNLSFKYAVYVLGSLSVPTQPLNDNSANVANVQFLNTATSNLPYYTVTPRWKRFQSLATSTSSMVFDGHGNLFITFSSQQTSTSNWATTVSLYKVDSNGLVTTVQTVSGFGQSGVALAVDSSNNIYWAVTNTTSNASDSTFLGNCNLYKIITNVNGTLTTSATPIVSITTIPNAQSTKLVFDTLGNLYWAIASETTAAISPLNYSSTSYVYKITLGTSVTSTVFTSVATVGAAGTDLAFDATGNLYWSIGSVGNGSTLNGTSYLYKITPSGTLSTFSTQSTYNAQNTKLIFDKNGVLYWFALNYETSSNYQGSTLAAFDSNGTLLNQFAWNYNAGACGTDIVFDSSGNLLMAFTSNFAGSVVQSHYIQKIPISYQMIGTSFQPIFGNPVIIATDSIWGTNGYPIINPINLSNPQVVNSSTTKLLFDANGNLFWSVGGASNYNYDYSTGHTYNIPTAAAPYNANNPTYYKCESFLHVLWNNTLETF